MSHFILDDVVVSSSVPFPGVLVSRSVLRTRARRLAVPSVVLPVLALGCLSAAPVAAAAQNTTAPTSSPLVPATGSTSHTVRAVPSPTSTVAPVSEAVTPESNRSGTRGAANVVQASPSTADRAAAKDAPPQQAATDAPVAGVRTKAPTTVTGSITPAKRTDAHAGEKVFGMPAPARPESAADDNAMLAWAIKNGTPQERRAMADEMGVTYPAAVSVLGTVCDKGQGYAGVWAVNFSTTEVRWNVTLDGVGYAGARVLPLSHGYGAIGVPNGRHTLAFVSPATGVPSARAVTSLQCGATKSAPTKSAPATSRPADPMPGHRVTAPQPTPHRVQARTAAKQHGRSAPAAPSTASAGRSSIVGPRVQTDRVAVASPERGFASADTVMALVAALGAVRVALARRRRS